MVVTGMRSGVAQQDSAGAASGGAGGGAVSPGMRKLENAAREFEGIMLASVWKAWNQSNQMGNPQDAIGTSMTSMGLEMAAMAMARKGGFGLAKMIVNSLKGDVPGQTARSD